MSKIARLDPVRVREIVAGFPKPDDWKLLKCSDLKRPGSTTIPSERIWKPLKECKEQGGVYAFIFPGDIFSARKQPRPIDLHAPMVDGEKRAIPFGVETHPDLLLADGRMVVYIGRSANLLDRVQGHFGAGEKSTLTQVRNGLVNSGVCKGREGAVDYMLEHATLAYILLPGDENVANRDIVEVSLWGKYMTPFNIKSEH